MKFVRLIIFIFLVIAKAGFGQSESCRKSTEGKDFWFGFMENRNYQPGHKTEITLTSIYTCKYDIFIGTATTSYASGILTPNVPIQVSNRVGHLWNHVVLKQFKIWRFISFQIIR